MPKTNVQRTHSEEGAHTEVQLMNADKSKKSEEFIDMKNESADTIKNQRLVDAMQEVLKDDNAYTRGKMAAALMESRLLSPIQRQTILTEKDGPSVRVRFESIQNDKGEKYYMGFTDLDEYEKWNEDDRHNQALIMTMEDFGNILIRNLNDLRGFVINPYGENISISKDLLLSLLKQREAKRNAHKAN